MGLTWEQFNTQVRLYIHNYNHVPDVQALIDALIASGVEDLQRSIVSYQTGHSDTYASASLTSQGFAQIGALPAGRVRSARMVKYDTADYLLRPNIFRPLQQVAWKHIHAMRGGEFAAFSGSIALDPVNRQFAISPPLNSETRLVIDWVGVKSAFQAADVTPFDAQAAEAVGLYVLAKITRVVDRDAAQSGSYTQSYSLLKRQLLSQARWEAVIDKLPDAQLDGDDTYATSTSDILMELFTYRPDLTALDTGAVNSLDSITTAEVVLTGTVLFLVISGVPQYWRLVLGTDEVVIIAYDSALTSWVTLADQRGFGG